MPPFRKTARVSDHDRKILQESKDYVKQLLEFREWKKTLDKLQWDNFIALINLPGAEKTIEACPNPEYKRMAMFGLKLVREENASKKIRPGPAKREIAGGYSDPRQSGVREEPETDS